MYPDHAEVRRIVLSVLETCSQCRAPHEPEDLQIIGRNGSLWVLSVQCSYCAAQAYVAAVVGDHGVDVTETDAVEWPDSLLHAVEVEDEIEPFTGAITVDDVLDMHEFLETFDGNFHALFARRRH